MRRAKIGFTVKGAFVRHSDKADRGKAVFNGKTFGFLQRLARDRSHQENIINLGEIIGQLMHRIGGRPL